MREKEEKKNLMKQQEKVRARPWFAVVERLNRRFFLLLSIRSTEVSQFKFSVDLKVETASEREVEEKTMN